MTIEQAAEIIHREICAGIYSQSLSRANPHVRQQCLKAARDILKAVKTP